MNSIRESSARLMKPSSLQCNESLLYPWLISIFSVTFLDIVWIVYILTSGVSNWVDVRSTNPWQRFSTDSVTQIECRYLMGFFIPFHKHLRSFDRHPLNHEVIDRGWNCVWDLLLMPANGSGMGKLMFPAGVYLIKVSHQCIRRGVNQFSDASALLGIFKALNRR